MGHVILITGRPGIGKTTLMRSLVKRLGSDAGGFYTEEIRAGVHRVGFRVRTLDGKIGLLAHKNVKTDRMIGKYYVDVAAFEEVALPALDEALERCSFIVIDEIGPMEEFSEAFRSRVQACLDSGKTVIAAIKENGSSFVRRIKRRPDAVVFTLTLQNRDMILDDILKTISHDVPAAP